MKLYCLVVPLALMFITPVHARMYQWQDPDTGTTQLSGKPPAWYRSGRVGPRVFVFDNGKIIDDTDVVLSEEHRNLMRQRAYLQADEDLIEAKRKAVASGRKKTALQEATRDAEDSLADEMDEEMSLEPSDESMEDADKRKSELTLDDMKRLIEDWEKQQEEKAREIIGN